MILIGGLLALVLLGVLLGFAEAKVRRTRRYGKAFQVVNGLTPKEQTERYRKMRKVWSDETQAKVKSDEAHVKTKSDEIQAKRAKRKLDETARKPHAPD